MYQILISDMPVLQVTSVHTILASNTSSISITKLGAATSRPHRVVSASWQYSSTAAAAASKEQTEWIGDLQLAVQQHG
jgi:hypothetical protein